MILPHGTRLPRPPSPQHNTISDRYVVATRAADLGAVLASNAHDFSIEQLSSTVSLDVAAMYYESFEPLKRFIFRGPRPAVVIETTENDAGDGARVILCRVSDGWKVEEGEARPSVDLSAGTETEYTIVTSAEGELIVDSVQPSGRACDATGAAVGTSRRPRPFRRSSRSPTCARHSGSGPRDGPTNDA